MCVSDFGVDVTVHFLFLVYGGIQALLFGKIVDVLLLLPYPAWTDVQFLSSLIEAFL